MKGQRWVFSALMAAAFLVAPIIGAELKVDLSKESVGKEPARFLPMVGVWSIVTDGADKVVRVEGTEWKKDLKSQPARNLAENARRIYGASHESFLDNVKEFAYFPIAVSTDVTDFTDGTISLKFKTISGDLDRCSGILFNLKTNGDWLTIRYNDTESNVVLWTFHDGVRRSVKRTREGSFPIDRSQWHELKMTVHGTDFKSWLDG